MQEALYNFTEPYKKSLVELFKRIEENGKHISAILFFIGFGFDYFLLPDSSTTISIVIGLGYLVGLAATIFLRTVFSKVRAEDLYTNKLTTLTTFAIAFFSGSLLSYIFVLYFRSASIATSWPFFIFLAAIIFLNEYSAGREVRLILDLIVLYVTATCACIYIVPTLAGTVNNYSLIIALILSGILSSLFMYALRQVTKAKFISNKRYTFLALLVPIFILALYGLDAIPPIPVGTKDVGVYHYVYKNPNGSYALSSETNDERSKLLFWKTPTYTFAPNQLMYFYSAVVAPAKLVAPVSHTWEFYDLGSGKWVEKSKVSFPIIGGRTDGYRAYSICPKPVAGKWRVTVSLGDNRIISRTNFIVTN